MAASPHGQLKTPAAKWVMSMVSLVPVPAGNQDVYREMTAQYIAVLMEYGATRVVDSWAENVPDGKVTDYKRAVKANDDEKVVYSWVEWPSKKVRDAGWEKVIADPRMYPEAHTIEPYDNMRRVHGGFTPILDI